MASSQGHHSRKMAAILHADVAGSTGLVQLDEAVAHERINEAFSRFSQSIEQYGGTVHEIRGDALVAEFSRASDAVCAALLFQKSHAQILEQLNDEITPTIRIGVSLGEVIFADGTVTGAGVVLAQRVEQLAESGGLCITGAIHEALPQYMPFDQENLGEQQVKGFDEPVRVYRVELRPGASIPPPQESSQPGVSPKTRGLIVAIAAMALVIAGGAAYWFKPWVPQEEPASVERMAFPLPDKPSIAVLPFDNLSDDAAQEHFVDGFTENIITELSRFGDLFVIARNSSFTYKDKPVKVQQVAEELGVQYILEGSIQWSNDKVRVTTQLIDAITGRHLWVERYDRELKDIFDLQDEVTRNIVASLPGRVAKSDLQRAQRKETTDLVAYDYFLLGSEHGRRYTKKDTAKWRELLQKAIEIDPQYARAYVGVAWSHFNDWWLGWSDDPQESANLAFESAKMAVELDDDLAEAHWVLAGVYMNIKKQSEGALAEYEQALRLNPNNADIMAMRGWDLPQVGRAEEGVKGIKKALRLNPHHPNWYEYALVYALYNAQQYEEVIALAEVIDKPIMSIYTVLAGSYAQLGKLENARETVAKALELQPEFSLSGWTKTHNFTNPEDLESYLDGLRIAGFPENPLLKLPDKPSIAVLPFTNMSDDPQQEYFVDGMTEDLITDLSKLPELFVIARNSTFSYKGKSIKVKQIAKDLGVRYVLEGSVRRAGNQVRINAQLIDALSEGHLWAERYDGALSDVFSLQDKVVRKIVTALEVELSTTQSSRLSKPQTINANAYDSLLKGWTYYRRNTPEDLARAVTHIEKAIEFDPKYSRAYAALAAVYQSVFNKNWFSGTSTWNHKLGISTDVVLHREKENLDLAMENPGQLAYRVLSHRLSWNGEHEQAISSARTAIELNPNDPVGHEALAIALIYAGEPQKAVELIEQAIRLDPHYPSEYIFWLGLAQFGLQKFNSAVDTLIRATQSNPDNEVALLLLAASYGHLGEPDIALDKVKEANELRNERQNGLIEAGLEPGVEFLLSGPFTLEDVNLWPFKLTEDRERLRQGLRLAGVSEQSESKVSPLIIAGAKTIDAMEAKKLHSQGKRFIDVRGIDSWKNGHIPGAVNIPLKDTFSEATLARVVSKQEPFVVYCMGPRCLLSSKACQQSVEWGYEQVHYFRAGFPSWKASEYPVEVP